MAELSSALVLVSLAHSLSLSLSLLPFFVSFALGLTCYLTYCSHLTYSIKGKEKDRSRDETGARDMSVSHSVDRTGVRGLAKSNII